MFSDKNKRLFLKSKLRFIRQEYATQKLRIGFSAKSAAFGELSIMRNADMPYIFITIFKTWRYNTCHRFLNLQANT